ncbi:MAG: SRPBCC family protein [Bacteroidota bacterium]
MREPEKEIEVTRLLNAPRELVFEVWTSPKHVDKWWGPDGFTNTTHKIDVRPGGEWVYVMHGPDSRTYDNRIRFIEVVRPEKLVYLHDSGKDNDPAEFQTFITFEAVGKQTKVTLRSVFKTKEARDFVVREFGALEGAKQHLGNLESYLSTL